MIFLKKTQPRSTQAKPGGRCKHEGIRRQYQVKLDRKLHETYNHYQTCTKLTKLASVLYIKLAKLTKLVKETRNPLFPPLHSLTPC